MSRLVRAFLRPVLAVCLAAVCGVASRGEEKKDTRPALDLPPPAKPFNGSVMRGERLEIPLRIYGLQSDPLRYLIRKPPLHGRLSEPRSTARDAAIVVYEPPADLAITADRFSYAVQSPAGVSAPVEVTISIVDLPAQFAVPASIEFGELLAGERAVREIEVSNRGGGVIEGTVEADPPLHVEGRTSYRLEAGDYTYFKIVFAPTEAGIFRREIRYTSHREFITSVSGSAQAPVSVQPVRVALRHDEGSAVRTAALEVINRTEKERTFKLSGGPRLQLLPEVTVPARGRVAVPVSLRAEDVAPLENAGIRLESDGFILTIPAHADVVGPVLRLPQPSVTLGRVDAARGMRSSVELENAGGTVAHVTAEVGAPFFLPEPAFDVQPGEKKRVALLIQPATAQRYRTWLKFNGGPTSAELEVDAELTPSMSGRGTRGSNETEKPDTTPAPKEVEPWMPDLNVARSIRVTNVRPTSADIEWPLDLSGAGAFRLDRLVLMRDSSGEVRNAWIELPKTTFTRRAPLWVASVTHLSPSQSQTIRVVPLGPEGQPRQALFRLDFNTPPAPSFPKPKALPTLFIALLGLGAFVLFRKLRRHYTEPISGF